MSDEPTLFDDDVAHARRTDPVTSHEAAGTIESDKIRRSQRAVLKLLRRLGPIDDARLVSMYSACRDRLDLPRQSASGIRTRRSELVTKGLVVDSGEKTVLPSGRRAILWAAV
jgi:hypothetical protein